MNDSYFTIRPQQPKYKFSPFYELFFGCIHLDIDLMQRLENYLLELELVIIDRYQVDESLSYDLEKTSVNSRFMLYNLFEIGDKNADITQLRLLIKDKVRDFLRYHNLEVQDLYASCWFIILRENQQLPEHTHDNSDRSFISGNLNVACEESTTEYVLPFQHGCYSIGNERGLLTLFPSAVAHYTSRHKGMHPRISVAFDICTCSADLKQEHAKRFVKL